tara:strand:- start:628 stop:906 length:279 start_codon:yes stop_codon:yes gene_type:complete
MAADYKRNVGGDAGGVLATQFKRRSPYSHEGMEDADLYKYPARESLQRARNLEVAASRAETPNEAGGIAVRSVAQRGEAMKKKGILSSRASK